MDTISEMADSANLSQTLAEARESRHLVDREVPAEGQQFPPRRRHFRRTDLLVGLASLVSLHHGEDADFMYDVWRRVVDWMGLGGQLGKRGIGGTGPQRLVLNEHI